MEYQRVRGADVMVSSLGSLIRILRKEQGISQGVLSRGLCSIANLSKIELGEREPGQMLFEALISRLGKDSIKWEILVSEEEKQLFEKRNRIEYFMQSEQLEKVEKELESYQITGGASKKLHEQYKCLSYGRLYQKRGEYDKAFEEVVKGLEKTDFYMKETVLEENQILSKSELQLLYVLGEIFVEEDMGVNPKFYWKVLFQYVNTKYMDPFYKVKFYIKAIYYLALIAYQEGQYGESLSYCKKGLEEIVQKKSSYFLKSFLILVKKLKENNKIDCSNFLVFPKDIEGLLEAIERCEEIAKQVKQKQQYIRSYNSMCSVNEVIKNTRLYSGKTQEEIGIGKHGEILLGNQSGISKIENGKRKPRKTNSQQYLKNLGLVGKEEAYRLSIQGKDFEIQDIRWQIDFYIGNHEYKKAEKLYKVLEEKIDMKNPYNKQYIKELEFLLYYEIENKFYQKGIDKIFKMLSLTRDDLERLKEEELGGFFTREELILLMNIGCVYHQNQEYEKALKYYCKVEQYLQDYYQSSSGNLYKSILHNLSQVYGLLGKYKKSMEKAKASLFIILLQNQGGRLESVLYNLGWCYGKMMLEEEEKQKKEEYRVLCNQFFDQAYCLAEFYKQQSICSLIKEKRIIWNLKKIVEEKVSNE